MVGMIVLLVFTLLAFLFQIFVVFCFFAASIVMYDEMGDGRYYKDKQMTEELPDNLSGNERQE
ncbi:hypothetical protein [Faecalicatena contorta]|uniref:hypothetical protein n=1 Tax=Faecalicatena contorta TaxID=39482 RepID=UPI001F486C4C|nr:hypothetical protein [Faecalicatena contorta]MCF2683819.1 hypothetical protein [Faecalicatena contorta]